MRTPRFAGCSAASFIPAASRLTRRTLELAELRAGERLLDVACGAGTSALLAASEFAADATGVEYGHDAVRAARAAASASGCAEHVRFLHGDAETLPVADDQFDVVLCECALCTFPDQRRAVAEFRRVLRPGGRLALSDVVVEGGPLPRAADRSDRDDRLHRRRALLDRLPTTPTRGRAHRRAKRTPPARRRDLRPAHRRPAQRRAPARHRTATRLTARDRGRDQSRQTSPRQITSGRLGYTIFIAQ